MSLKYIVQDSYKLLVKREFINLIVASKLLETLDNV